jgi:hypothetical protein
MTTNQAKAHVDLLVTLFGAQGHQGSLTHQLIQQYGTTGWAKKPCPEDLQGNMGQCYYNAMVMAVNHPERWTYCEGYAVLETLGVPMEHAWCLDSNGNVVDPTWEGAADYFGVRINSIDLMRIANKTEYHGVFCNMHILARKLGRDCVKPFLEDIFEMSK